MKNYNHHLKKVCESWENLFYVPSNLIDFKMGVIAVKQDSVALWDLDAATRCLVVEELIK